MTAPELVIPLQHLADASARVRRPSCCETRRALSVWLVDPSSQLNAFDWSVVLIHEQDCPVHGAHPRLRAIEGAGVIPMAGTRITRSDDREM